MAGLHPSQIDEFVPVIRAIRDTGVAVFVIEHVIQAALSLSGQLYLLSCRRIIACGAARFGKVVITY